MVKGTAIAMAMAMESTREASSKMRAMTIPPSRTAWERVRRGGRRSP